MRRRVGERIRAYGERRGLERYDFDRVGKVTFVSRAVDHSGNAVAGTIGADDLVVIGMVSMGTAYRGIVRFDLLNSLPSNPIQRGYKYRFQSNDTPKFEGSSCGVFRIENIIPAKSLKFWFFGLFGY